MPKIETTELTLADFNEVPQYSEEYIAKAVKELKRREATKGYKRYFVPGTPFGIENCPKHFAFFEATKTYRQTMFRAGNRCLAEGTMVATPVGPVPIEDIKVGDFVYDRYGNPTRVMAVWYNGWAEVVTLTNRGKPYVKCTATHEMDCYINKKQSRLDTSVAKQGRVQAGDLYEATPVRRMTVKAPLGSVRVPEAYALGALLGDGCATCGSSGTVVISSINNLIPDKVADCYGSVAKKLGSDNYSWSIKTPACSRYDLWMRGKLAHQKSPRIDDIATWDRESVLQFVAGLIDSDGSMSRGRDGCSLALSSQCKDILDAYAYCVLSLWNEQVTVSVDNRAKYVNGQVSAAIIRNPHKLRVVCEELAPYVVHKYKVDYSAVAGCGKRSYADAISLTPEATGEKARVFDITVEHPEHFYLLANGVSVSNCGKTLAGAYGCTVWTVQDYPDWWPGRVFRGPISAWACGKTVQITRDTVQKELVGPLGQAGTGMIPADRIKKIWARAGTPGSIDTLEIMNDWGDVSLLGFKSYDQGPDAFVGTAKHVIWEDEEPAEMTHNECLFRTATTNGLVMNTVTPINGLTQYIAEFDKDADHLAGAQYVVQVSDD